MKLVIVSTIKGAHVLIDSYVKYHLSIGFDKIILFLDDPKESYPELDQYDKVIVIKSDGKLKKRWEEAIIYEGYKEYIETDILARQALNLDVALNISKKLNIDWLLHIDCDELFYSPSSSVLGHFEELTKNNYSVYRYTNLETITDKIDINNAFEEVVTFKKTEVV